jgi:hypothetical protein
MDTPDKRIAEFNLRAEAKGWLQVCDPSNAFVLAYGRYEPRHNWSAALSERAAAPAAPEIQILSRASSRG